MNMSMKKVANVDEYIKTFPWDVMVILEKIRKIVKKVAPTAEEKISYGMPAFKLNGKILLYYAARQRHIGFYAASGWVKMKFTKELKGYKMTKGTIQFQLNEDIPYELIKKVVEFRVKENLAHQKTKKSRK